MSHSVKSVDEDMLIDSWVDLNATGEISRGSEGSQKRSTPIASLISSGKLEKLLWEAQRESCQSSLIGSGISSQRGSPKSPHSPVTEEAAVDETFPSQEASSLAGTSPAFEKAKVLAGLRRHGSTDWIWEWSSKPEQRPPKEWKLKHPRPILSLRNSKVAKSGLFSPDIITILIVSNLLSVLIGCGIGFYMTKRAGGSEFFYWSRN